MMQGLLGQEPQQQGVLGNPYAGLFDKYKHLNFMQRTINPEAPQIQNPDGSVSTHRMAAEVDENGEPTFGGRVFGGSQASHYHELTGI